MLISHKYEHFRHIKSKLLISCPKDANDPGGLYIVDFELNTISQILVGDCRGIAPYIHGYFIATNSNGILKLDKQFNVLNQYESPSLDLHGAMIDGHESLLYVVETKHNTIGIYKIDPFMRIDEIKISHYDTDHNHINDIWIESDSMYVSMFSFEHNWRRVEGTYDGVIAEYDIPTKSFKKIIHSGLQLPHTVKIINGDIYYCDSLNLNIKRDDSTIAQFNGFTRGLAYDDWHFYVGQSELRHLEKIVKKLNNVTLDCGIHIFDPISHTSRFFKIPANQIYEIIIINETTADKHPPSSLELFQENSTQYLVAGDWHINEPNLRWMASRSASLYLHSEEPVQLLKFEAFNGLPENYNIKIFINNTKIYELEFEGNQEIATEIKLENTVVGDVKITFEVSELWLPAERLGTDDDRKLGLALRKVSLY